MKITRDTVQLVRNPTAEGEDILISVGGSGEENASSDEIEVEWEERGVLRIRLPVDKRYLAMQCVVNGSWELDDGFGWE